MRGAWGRDPGVAGRRVAPVGSSHLSVGSGDAGGTDGKFPLPGDVPRGWGPSLAAPEDAATPGRGLLPLVCLPFRFEWCRLLQGNDGAFDYVLV